jgi:hypothetical protein
MAGGITRDILAAEEWRCAALFAFQSTPLKR